MKKFVYVLIFFGFAGAAYGQELAPLVKPEVNPDHVLYKKTVWRRMNMEESMNRPFYSKNGELPRLLLEAVQAGLLKPYNTDTCINIMPDDVFNSRIRLENEASDDGFGGGFDSFGGGFGGEQTESAEEAGPSYTAIPPEEFSVLWIKEDVIFDRNRTRMYHYIRSITLKLPGGPENLIWNEAGFEKEIASFRYDDVVALFRGPYADRAIWYNNQNQAQNVNFSDAFELRLFRAPIIKISNAQNLDIRQEYQDLIAKDPLNAMMIQQKYEYDLMEYESQLWEY